MKKILFFLLLVALVGCKAKTVKESFKIGTDATYPPFETIDATNGKIVGFDIDLMTEICQRMAIEPEFVVVPFDGIISGLNKKKYDAVISAMTITGDRAKEVNFSNPYYLAGQSIAVRVDENKVDVPDDLIGKTIGVQLGTTGEMEAKKIKDTEVVSYDNISAAFIDLENKKIDAIINDIPTNKSIIAQKSQTIKTAGKLLTKEYYGICLRKEDDKLLEKINSILTELEKSGWLKELKTKWQIGD